jgi:hypothetical protein
MDCCVCFETKTYLIFKTICNHTICLECFLKLKKIKCPMCREKFPPEINNLTEKPTTENPHIIPTNHPQYGHVFYDSNYINNSSADNYNRWENDYEYTPQELQNEINREYNNWNNIINNNSN